METRPSPGYAVAPDPIAVHSMLPPQPLEPYATARSNSDSSCLENPLELVPLK